MIGIFAPEIISNGATLSASADAGSPAGSVVLVTSKITNTGGLTINNNGDGNFTGDTHVGIWPVGAWGVAFPPTNIDAFVTMADFQYSSQPLDIVDGGGTGALTITANGNNRGIQIYGYPLTVTPASTNITQQGTGDAIYFASSDDQGNMGVLTLGGTIAIHGNTTATGAANVLDIRASQVPTLTGHVLLDTSGLTGGDGGDVTLPIDTGALALGATGNTLAIKTDGSTTGGKGGNVVVGYGGTLAITLGSGNAITASSHSGDSDGGSIDIYAHSIASTTGVDSFIASDASGTGTGGAITITGDGDVELSNISSNGGCDGGTGGDITINADNLGVAEVDANTNVCSAFAARSAKRIAPRSGSNGGTTTLNATKLNEAKINGYHRDGVGNGKGGTIIINTGTAVDLSNLAPGKISAIGGHDGEGGSIQVINLQTWPTAGIITTVFDVHGGDSLSESADDGKIIVNSTTCQQRNIPSFSGSAAVTYWNCVDGTQFSPILGGLSTKSKASYAAAKVHLHYFQNRTAANNFLGSAQVDQAGDNGFSKYLGGENNYTVVYADPTSSAGNLDAVTRHETGHQLDHYYGNVATSAYFKDLVANDWLNFNGRPSCVLFPSICTGGVLNAPYNSYPAATRNQQILSTLPTGIPVYFQPTGEQWREIFAEEFAITSGGGYDGFIDGWLA